MIQAIPKPMSFDEFLEWHPEDGRIFELMKGCRKGLFFPALSLLRWNSSIRDRRELLLNRGKTKRQVVGAVMHKLIRWIFGILHSGKPFDPAIAFPNQEA